MYKNLENEIKLQDRTQAQMARYLGMSRQLFNMKLKGSRQFNAHERRILSKKLRKSIRYLFEVRDDTTT